jgi:hypothetical protein
LNFYGGEPDGLLRYFVEVVGPYARLINKGFPSRAACSADVPDSTKVFMLPHIANLLRFLVRYCFGSSSAATR